MKVKVMNIAVVDKRGTCDQRKDAAEAEFTIFNQLPTYMPETTKKTFYEQTACLCAKNKSSKVQKFLPSASRRKSSESVLLLIHVQGQQPATFVYLCWD